MVKKVDNKRVKSITDDFNKFSNCNFDDTSEFFDLLDSVINDSRKKSEFKKCVGTIGWSLIASNALRQDKFEVVEEIMDLLYGKTKYRMGLYDDDRVCRYKLLYGKDGIEGNTGEVNDDKAEDNKCSTSMNMGLLIGGLKNLKNRSQIKRFFLLENNFNFTKKENVVLIGKIIERFLEEDKVDDNTKDLLRFFKEKGIFKKFNFIFEDYTNDEGEGKFKFFDRASKEIFEYLVVDCDLYGDYLEGDNEQKTELVQEAICSKEYDKLEILFNIPGIDIEKIKETMNSNAKIISRDLIKIKGKEKAGKYWKKLGSMLSGDKARNISSKNNVKKAKNDTVNIQSYINAIKDDDNVIEIFNKFGIEGNPSKEQGMIVLLAAIKEYKQQDEEKMSRCYEILQEEMNNLGEQADWTKIIASVVSLKDVDILKNFLIQKEKQGISVSNIDWNKILQIVYYSRDTNCRMDMLNILINDCKSVFKINWEKELVEIYERGDKCMGVYLLNTYESEINKFLLIKEVINKGDSELLDELVDEYKDSEEFYNNLGDILQYLYGENLDLFKEIVTKYGNNKIRNELFGALYKNESKEKWTFSLVEGDKARVKELRKYFLNNEKGLMFICESASEFRYLELEYQLDENTLNAGDLMFEASKREDLDLIKHLLKRIDTEKLDGRWIKQLELLGSKDIYNNVINYIVDQNMKLSLNEESYFAARKCIRKKIGKEELECVTYNKDSIKSIGDVMLVARGMGKKKVPLGVLKDMLSIANSSYFK